jgi:hypothetical protein
VDVVYGGDVAELDGGLSVNPEVTLAQTHDPNETLAKAFLTI